MKEKTNIICVLKLQLTLKLSMETARESITSASIDSSSKSIKSIFSRICGKNYIVNRILKSRFNPDVHKGAIGLCKLRIQDTKNFYTTNVNSLYPPRESQHFPELAKPYHNTHTLVNTTCSQCTALIQEQGRYSLTV